MNTLAGISPVLPVRPCSVGASATLNTEGPVGLSVGFAGALGISVGF